MVDSLELVFLGLKFFSLFSLFLRKLKILYFMSRTGVKSVRFSTTRIKTIKFFLDTKIKTTEVNGLSINSVSKIFYKSNKL